jgi:DNA-binding XRE family transcriptional regulator
LARTIGYDESTCRAWEKGKLEPSDDVVKACIRLACQKIQELEDAYERARTYWAVD